MLISKSKERIVALLRRENQITAANTIEKLCSVLDDRDQTIRDLTDDLKTAKAEVVRLAVELATIKGMYGHVVLSHTKNHGMGYRISDWVNQVLKIEEPTTGVDKSG